MDFSGFCVKYGVNSENKKKLEEEGLGELNNLLEVSETDLKELEIKPIGQRKAIFRGIKEQKLDKVCVAAGVYSKISNINPKAMLDETEDNDDITIKKGSSRQPGSDEDNGSSSEEYHSFGEPETIGEERERTVKKKKKHWMPQKLRNIKLPERLRKYHKKMCKNQSFKGSVVVTEEVETNGNLECYSCVLHEVWRDDKRKIRKLVSGECLDMDRSRTIILVGATGSGKSTLIDGMGNFLFNVKFNQDDRLRLVKLTEEEKNNSSCQSRSQTEWITVYTIPPAEETKTDFTLTIVDTPGFADTRGVERDKEILKQIQHFFENPEKHGVDMVNGICFVLSASEARLSHHQKYVFQEILSMFGKDVEDNIFIMATWADGNDPAVLASLKEAEVPYKELFLFNNTALFTPTVNIEPRKKRFFQCFWDLGMDSYQQFFDELMTISPKSLFLSATVLQERELLVQNLEELKKSIMEIGFKKLSFEEEKRTMTKHEKDILENKNFKYKAQQPCKEKIDVPPGVYTTNCNNCNTDCHKKCTIKEKDGKSGCWAMYKTPWHKKKGFCSQCPGKCHWSDHDNHRYVTMDGFRIVEQEYDDMKRRYNKAEKRIKSLKDILECLQNDIDKCMDEINKYVKRGKECINRIREISLKPDPLSDVDYIEMMMYNEEKNQEDGWKTRLEVLEKIQESATLTRAMLESNGSFSHENTLELFNSMAKP